MSTGSQFLPEHFINRELSWLEFNERVRLDIAYERHRCLWLDLQLIVRTVGCMFTQRGAN